MRTLTEFTEEARKAGVHIQVDTAHLDRLARHSVDGLFHVPLISLCVLIVARAQKGDLLTADAAAWTGAALGRYFAGLEAAHRKLEWSLQHRTRCADAVVFLENIQLVTVQETPLRSIRCTIKGYEFVGKLLRRPDDVGVLARGIDRAHRALAHQGLDLL